MKPLLLQALDFAPLPRPPLWLMRQAGRYLPEYRAVKEQSDFLSMCRTPKLACEVTLQPLRRYKLDAAIVFADILLPAAAIGFEVAFNPGPKIANPIARPEDLSRLNPRPELSSLNFLFQTLAQLQEVLPQYAVEGHRPALLGFAGTPWTLACYLLEQAPYKHFEGTTIFAARYPEALAQFLEILTELTTSYLLAQLKSGADAVQLFDSWGGILSEQDYRQWSLPYINRIASAVRAAGFPILLYVNGSAALLSALASAEVNCLSLDWRTDLREARRVLGTRKAIQGNLSPSDLFLPPEKLHARVQQMLQAVDPTRGYIANLGHGVLQHTPPENVAVFIDALHSLSAKGAR